VTASSARAQPAPERALAAERAADPAVARAAWQAVAAEQHGSRDAAHARTRLEWLAARSEGDLAPLASLMRYQVTPLEERTIEVASAFAQVVEEMPEGRVRVESRAAVADDLLRLGALSHARAVFEAQLRDGLAGEAERRGARDGVARALARGGDQRGALDYLERDGLAAGGTYEALRRERLVRVSTPFAAAALGLYVLLSLALGLRALARGGAAAARAAWAPQRAAAALWIALGPALLAAWYDDEAADTFLALCAGTLLLTALGSIAGRAVAGRAGRAALSALAVLAHLALAWWVLLGSGGLVSFL